MDKDDRKAASKIGWPPGPLPQIKFLSYGSAKPKSKYRQFPVAAGFRQAHP
jgi:hypothetical protein